MKWLCAVFLLISFDSSADLRRDPTRPAWVESVAESTEKKTSATPEAPTAMSGILYSKQRQLVLLNNRFYRVGDRFGNHTIKRIEADRIWLSGAERDWVMQLPSVAQIQKHQ